LSSLCSGCCKLDAETLALVIGGIVTVFTSLGAVLANRHVERQCETFARRVPAAERFAAVWMRTLMGDKMGKPIRDEDGSLVADYLKEYQEATISIMLWASDDFIRDLGKARSEFLAVSQSGGAEQVHRSLSRFEDVLMNLRREVGNPDTALKRGDLLRLFVN
jgi:hypothetical protein